jgi:ribosomal protein S18 acetylase RimI-like enzyme
VTLLQQEKPILSGDYSIRLGTLDDADALADLGAKTFYETFASDNTAENMNLYVEENFTLQKLKEEMNDPAATFLLAEDGDSFVGYAKLRRTDPPKELGSSAGLEIQRLYSIKEYHGKKVGRALMLACLSVAAQENFKLIWLGVWENNAKAIAFYEKWGFEKFGAHTFMLGTDLQTDLLMKKKLD